MTAIPPLPCRWTGSEFEPLGRFKETADAHLVIGQRYDLEIRQERSEPSHRHFFAEVHEAWLNLPEDEAERFATSEHLRKWALIRAGYRDERTLVCSSKAEAQRVAAFVRPLDEYAVVVVRDAVVIVYTAKSQSYRAMGKQDFQASKDAVLQVIAELIGVSPAEIAKNAREVV